MRGTFKVTTTSLNTNQKGNYSRNFLRETTQEAETTQETSYMETTQETSYRETTQETS
jgi:hypothetical protein